MHVTESIRFIQQFFLEFAFKSSEFEFDFPASSLEKRQDEVQKKSLYFRTKGACSLGANTVVVKCTRFLINRAVSDI